jgi:hypothetical protein
MCRHPSYSVATTTVPLLLAILLPTCNPEAMCKKNSPCQKFYAFSVSVSLFQADVITVSALETVQISYYFFYSERQHSRITV